MATEKQITSFINTIGPIIQKYAKQKGYKVVSPIIAQACLESKYGLSGLAKYHNYFGLKCGSKWTGKYVVKGTKEEYIVGQLTPVKAAFRSFDNMEEGVKGYFDFISTVRYSNLKSATTPYDYLTKIKSDGYATSSSYVTNNMNVVNKYNLIKFDTINPYYRKYSGTSTKLDTILAAIGVETKYYGNVDKRRALATANSITNYTGSLTQNLKLISLAKTGKLKRVL